MFTNFASGMPHDCAPIDITRELYQMTVNITVISMILNHAKIIKVSRHKYLLLIQNKFYCKLAHYDNLQV